MNSRDTERQNNDIEFWEPRTPPANRQLWRYIDFTQLNSILERGSLWFNRADLFDDPLEASMPRANVDTRNMRYAETEIPESALETMSKSFEKHRKTTYLSCWHLNQYESAAMWDQYSRENQGIAIQSTVGDTIDALTEPGDVWISGEK
jgi:hypothetical protein